MGVTPPNINNPGARPGTHGGKVAKYQIKRTNSRAFHPEAVLVQVYDTTNECEVANPGVTPQSVFSGSPYHHDFFLYRMYKKSETIPKSIPVNPRRMGVTNTGFKIRLGMFNSNTHELITTYESGRDAATKLSIDYGSFMEWFVNGKPPLAIRRQAKIQGIHPHALCARQYSHLTDRTVLQTSFYIKVFR